MVVMGFLAPPSAAAVCFFGFFYAIGGDFEDAFAVGEVGAADEAGYADGAAAGFAEVNAGVAGVGYDVASDGVDGVAKEDIGFGHDLVGNDCSGVEGSC
jgi:hypothetical protein